MIKTKIYRLISRYFRGDEFNARHWSNLQLRIFGEKISGRVINISAGDDSDKEGNYYKSYFPHASNYSLSNYVKLQGLENEIQLDLEVERMPHDLISKYSLVLNHTVLEHIFDVSIAVQNITSLSSDSIATIVPFIQSYHHDTWYDDYWRFTPKSLEILFQKNGFKTVYVNWNEDLCGNIYIFHFCSKNPEKWYGSFQGISSKIYGPGKLRDCIF